MQKLQYTENTQTDRNAHAQAKSWNVHTPGHKPTRSVCPTYVHLCLVPQNCSCKIPPAVSQAGAKGCPVIKPERE